MSQATLRIASLTRMAWGGDQLILPDMDVITYEDDAPETIAGFGLIASDLVRGVTLNIGSANGVPGTLGGGD